MRLSTCRTLLTDVALHRAQWLEARKGRISATKIATVLGMNPYQSPLALWCQETRKVQDDYAGNAYTRLGSLLEPFVMDLLAGEIGHPVVAADALYQHQTVDLAIASPDALVEMPGGALQLAELKTANARMAYAWEDGAVPDRYALQLQWQMGVTGVHEGYIACMIGGDPTDLPHPLLEFDQELWELMLGAATRFVECVVRDVPPAPGPGDAKLIESLVDRTESIRPLSEAEQVEADAIIPELLAARARKKEIQKDLDSVGDTAKTLENRLRLLLGSSTSAYGAGYQIDLKRVYVPARQNSAYFYTPVRLKKRSN